MALTLRRTKGSQLREAGYSDSELAKAGGKGKRSRRYLIGERQYWADDSELPGLILAAAFKPEKSPVEAAKRPAKSVKRAQEATKAPAAVELPAAPMRTPQARLEAFQRQFQMAENEVLLRSLQVAMARLAEMEDDDEMVLLLA